MGRVVHARLDGASQMSLKRLRRRLGWNDSQILREGLRALATRHLRTGKRTIVGLGQFASGVVDLGSSKARLQGFGR